MNVVRRELVCGCVLVSAQFVLALFYFGLFHHRLIFLKGFSDRRNESVYRIWNDPSGEMHSTPSLRSEDNSKSGHTPNSNFLTVNEIPRIKVSGGNCAKLIEGDEIELRKSLTFQSKHPKLNSSDEQIFKRASNCSTFLSDRKYILKPSSEDEANFPLAFSILLYKDVEQFERLLRVIYRPQNYYCVHVDKKSSKAVQNAVGAIVKCFENVFMAPEQIDVKWGEYSVLEPELSCMKGLLKHKKWRYFINLTGQEFPLKTNWELVEILKILNGANSVGATMKRRIMGRIEPFFPAPYNITVTKGSVHIVVTRGFVDYTINNATSLEILEWVKKTIIPDETYFSTLSHNPQLGVPGAYLGCPEDDLETNWFLPRFKVWVPSWDSNLYNWPCYGKYVHGVCIFGLQDLPMLTNRVELFANKFHLDYQPLVLDCLEEFYFNRTLEELTSGPKINRTFYAGLDYVKNHVHDDAIESLESDIVFQKILAEYKENRHGR